MLYIAHRGLYNGPDERKENHPDQIKSAWNKGYHVEIDIRYVDKKLVLGHDQPQYEINKEFLDTTKTWIHCKNLEALYYFSTSTLESYNYFWHENDQYTLTSKQFIWAYPGMPLTDNSIMVMPEHVDASLNNTKLAACYGICSDYVEKIKELRQ